MDEYINREDVLKCLEYNTIQKPSANDGAQQCELSRPGQRVLSACH